MPPALFLPILMRLSGPLAFVTAAGVAGVLNRSFVLIFVLAAVATATTIVIRKISPSPAMDLKAVFSSDPSAPPPSIFRGASRRFAIGLIGYALVFGLAAMIAAIFKTTEFEPQIRADDIWFLVVPAGIAMAGAWVSARLGMAQMAGMMDQMQGVFSQMQARETAQSAEDDAFTVEGEIIDPDRRDS